MVKCNGVIVTTYQGILSYQVLLLKQDWHYVLLDEGHKIRNPDSQITVACKQVLYWYFFYHILQYTVIRFVFKQ